MNQTSPSSRQKRHRLASLALAPLLGLFVASAFLTAGCGGSSSSSASASSVASRGVGRAAIRIQWPARTTSRLIPAASNSLVVEILRAGTVLQSQILARPPDPNDGSAPTSTVTFTDLPLDTLTVISTAYPSTEGSGVAQATGTTTLTTQADDTVGFDLTMSTTVDHLVVTPANPTVGSDKTQPLSVSGRAGASDTTPVVLLSPSKLIWQSSDATVASVDSNGIVKGGGQGTATITVSDTESGKTATATVRVQVPDSAGPAQFNPNGVSYAGTTTVADGSGSWTATGDAYTFDTTADPPTLRNTTKSTLVATGKLIGGYAVFDFPGNISVTKSTVTATGSYPLVLLTQGDFTLNGAAIFSVTAGNGGPGSGQLNGTRGNASAQYGGGSFGGLGGGPTRGTYGDDFVGAVSHLQGGSSGYGYNVNAAGGGGVYVGAVGTITLNSASLIVNGTRATTPILSRPGYPGGGGSGGGIALFGGGVSFSAATVSASGGNGYDGRLVSLGGFGSTTQGVIGVGYGGGGGRIAVGYGQGTPAPDLGFINVNGGSVPAGRTGSPGVKSSVPFAGF